MALRRAIVLTLVATAAMSGCSLGGFTGFSSGGVDPNDAGTDATTNTTDDGGKPDVVAPANDASDDGEAGPFDAGTCTALFCDGFERTTAIELGWNAIVAEGGGTIEGTTAPSPVLAGMRSLKVHTATSGSSRGFLEKKLATSTKRATVSFWMHMPASDRVLQIARLGLETPEGKSGIFLLQSKADGTLIAAEQYYNGTDYVNFVPHDLTAFKADTWQHWKLEIDATTSPPHGKVFVGGAPAGDFVLTSAFSAGAVRLFLGSTYAESGSSITAFFDDVGLDFVP